MLGPAALSVPLGEATRTEGGGVSFAGGSRVAGRRDDICRANDIVGARLTVFLTLVVGDMERSGVSLLAVVSMEGRAQSGEREEFGAVLTNSPSAVGSKPRLEAASNNRAHAPSSCEGGGGGDCGSDCGDGDWDGGGEGDGLNCLP